MERTSAADEEQRDNPAAKLKSYLDYTAKQWEQNLGEEECREFERDNCENDNADSNDNTCNDVGQSYVLGVKFFHGIFPFYCDLGVSDGIG